MDDRSIASLSVRVAGKSACRYKVSAIALGRGGEVLAYACNRPRFEKYHGGVHAEMAVLRKCNPLKVKTIIVTRVNKRGDVLPIEVCSRCRKVLDKLGIQARTVL